MPLMGPDSSSKTAKLRQCPGDRKRHRSHKSTMSTKCTTWLLWADQGRRWRDIRIGVSLRDEGSEVRRGVRTCSTTAKLGYCSGLPPSLSEVKFESCPQLLGSWVMLLFSSSRTVSLRVSSRATEANRTSFRQHILRRIRMVRNTASRGPCRIPADNGWGHAPSDRTNRGGDIRDPVVVGS